MKKRNALILLPVIISITVYSQKPADILNKWNTVAPIQKSYLHLDRDNYLAGETAWFKAYLYSDFLPDTISTTLYVELLNHSSAILSRVVLPVFLGSTNGQLELPDTLTSGNYTIRSYSATMLNMDPSFVSTQHIFIYGKNKITPLEIVNEKFHLSFFPEGGNLVSGFSNSIAFKATNGNGFPIHVSGKIYNEKNEVVTNFNTYHDGMGMFEITPSAQEKYYAIVDGVADKYYLPASSHSGVVLKMMPHPQGIFFELLQSIEDQAMQAAYMVGQMQHHVVFSQHFTPGKKNLEGVINTSNLHSGILQVTFFNKDHMPLAERLCFVNNKEFLLKAIIKEDTIDFTSRAKNRISLQFTDTVRGNFSVSVIDNDYTTSSSSQNNIFTNLLLTSDIKGYVHYPAYYFSSDNDSVKNALDLVMMTNGWRRFSWKEIAEKGASPVLYKDASYISLAGKVTLRGSQKPFSEKPLLLMLITADSTRRIQMINTDKQGNFMLDSMLFFGKSRLHFSDIRGKKSQFIDVKLTTDSISKTFLLPAIATFPTINTNATSSINAKIQIDYEALKNSRGLMLEGITIKARKKNPIEELEEKYASGMFSGGGNKTIDLVNTKETEVYQNIFDYLRTKVPGLTVMEPNYESAAMPSMSTTSIDDGTSYKLYYRYAPSASDLGPIPMTLYLNETETSASVIATIPADQIAMVKVFSSFVGAVGNGAGGALAIYTKRDADINTLNTAASLIKYNGYTIIKEFYTPDYKVDQSRGPADNRITLQWRPQIRVNNVNAKMPITFYNNDRTKSFKVIVEGMTIDGKMLSIEKIISFDKKSF